MASLVSPGVSVTVTDESFFIPASAPTVPLFFVATQASKTQPDGSNLATGTLENSVVRTVTSVAQSVQLYGVPHFRVAPGDENIPVASRRQQHGDARNEFGLMALNMALGVLDRAFVVRADVDLADNPSFSLVAAAPTFSGTGNGSLTVTDVDQANALEEVWTIRAVNATDFDVSGSISGAQGTATVGSSYSNGLISFDIIDGSTAFEAGDQFTVSITEQVGASPLGVNDAQRRANIVASLASEINTNQAVRSEQFEYNLILCPGYPEVVDEMQVLSVEILEEALVIADTPMNMDSQQVVDWSQTADRIRGTNVAYYYPHALVSNLDGAEVVAPASAVALRTIAFNDRNAQLWFAPAGARRGLVTGVSRVGYVSGSLGNPTSFVELALNQGQRDSLYENPININPIVFFPGRGLLVWGQKTSASAASALDRINVSRLLMFIKRELRKGAFPFVFEPNDQITRDNLKAMIDGFLGDILTKRGLFDFVVLSDSSNNTPARIDRGELYADVAIKPTKAAEFVFIPVRVLNTGDSI